MRLCDLDGCDRPHLAQGWCGLHYQRWWVHGDPLAGQPLRVFANEAERFWSKVNVGQASECWPWTRSIGSHGYGQFKVDGTEVLAHRYAYEHTVGPIPAGMQLDHLCRNRACCNPQHLEVVTNRENGLRGTSPTAANARKTHCIRGHEFTEANTIRTSQGKRQCRTCQYYRDTKRRAKQATMKEA